MNFLKTLLPSLCCILLFACMQEGPNTLKVGVIAGPEAELMETAKTVAAQQSDLKIKLITFSDYSMPNTALDDGSIDANVFQHQPYLDQNIKAHGYALVSIAKTFIYPMGLYSTKHQALNTLPTNAIVAIPNDPSNSARALLLLQKAKLIELKNGGTAESSPLDVISNPKDLHIKELDAAQLPRVLPDVDLAVINTNYAIPAGLSPSRDALLREGVDSLYANIVAVRRDEQNQLKMQQLVSALHSQAVLDKAQALFAGEAIKAW